MGTLRLERKFSVAPPSIWQVGLRQHQEDSYQSPAYPDISDCEVKLRNITILTPDNSTNGKCLHLVNCAMFEISSCVLVSGSRSTDMAPYPAR